SVIDLVFILLISNSVQNAMVGPNATLSGGLVAASALFLTNALLKTILYYFPQFGKLVQGESMLLIYKGRLNRQNMKKARLTMDEITEAVRQHGVTEIDNVDLAVLEVDGNISVISDDYKHRTIKKRKSSKNVQKSQ
ncbi:MAG: DUF421 domain-containing protein, partial [Clostridiales bacterium]|nr:DUF421 domain-containing protein [Clostridiales bacterium]